MVVYLNGEFVPAESAAVPIDDPGFLYGVGVYETVLIRKGRPLFWEDHWERLTASADALDLALPLSFERATDVLRELVRRNDLPSAVGRLQLTGSGEGVALPGSGNGRWGRPAPASARTVLIQIVPPVDHTAEEVLRGWKIVLSRTPYVPFLPQVKHTNRLPNVLARREARAANAQETILVDPEGVLLEGTRSTLFFLGGGVLHTPALECGILPGVTRQKVLLVAGRDGIPVNEGVHFAFELAEAEEAFLAFTSGGILPVTDIDGAPVGKGRMGPVTARLRAAYEELLLRAFARAPALV